MYDITSIEGLIAALGGDTAVAAWLGVSQPAVANWKARGDIPGGWHMRLFARVVQMGMTIDPAVFGLTPSEAVAINRVAAGNARTERNVAAA